MERAIKFWYRTKEEEPPSRSITVKIIWRSLHEFDWKPAFMSSKILTAVSSEG